MGEPNVILADMPVKIKAYTAKNEDGTYTIILNSRMTHYQHLISYHHELTHIESGDYDICNNVNMIELFAH